MHPHRDEPLHGPFLWKDARRLVLLAPGLWILIVLAVFSLVTFVQGRMWTEPAFALTFLVGLLSAILLAVGLGGMSTQLRQRRAAGLEFFGPEQLFWLVRYRGQPRVLGVTGDQLCLVPLRPTSFPPALWHAYRQTYSLSELTAVELLPAPGFFARIRGAEILRLFLASGESLDCQLFSSGRRALQQWRAVLSGDAEAADDPAPALRPEGVAATEHTVDPAELRRRIEDLLRLREYDIELVQAGRERTELHLLSPRLPVVRQPPILRPKAKPPTAESLLVLAGAAARAALLGQQGVQLPPRIVELRYETLQPAQGGGVDAQAFVQPTEARERSVRVALQQRLAGEVRPLATATVRLYLEEEKASA